MSGDGDVLGVCMCWLLGGLSRRVGGWVFRWMDGWADRGGWLCGLMCGCLGRCVFWCGWVVVFWLSG